MLCDAHPSIEHIPLGCGMCRSCLKVKNGVHPDLHILMSEAESVARGQSRTETKKKPARGILVDQVRELSRKIRMKAHEGRAKIAVIVDSHLMNTNAANALLKTLEEPPEDTLLILLAPHTRSLLPTVVSRCQRLVFSPLTVEHIEQILRRMEVDHASERARAADGSVAHAIAWEPSGEDADKAKGDELLKALLEGTTGDRLDAAERVGKERGDADHILQHVERGLALRLRGFAGEWAQRSRAESRRLLELLEATTRARNLIRDNAHVQLTLEQLLLDAAQTFSPGDATKDERSGPLP